MQTRIPIRIMFALIASLCVQFASPPAANAGSGDCGQPVTGGPSPTATDALYVLRAAVGIDACSTDVCDTDGSCVITAGDALRLLAIVTGGQQGLACGLCGGSTTTTSTSTTSTTMEAASTWTDVMAIFEARSCALSGCHGNGSSAGDLGGLDNFNSGHSELLGNNVDCIGSGYNSIVVPFNSDASFLVAKVEGFHDCGSSMPLVGSSFSADDMNVLRSWIDAGAAKN